MNIIFLIYDSRSGSTLLSKLMCNIPGVWVTPEIDIIPLIKLFYSKKPTEKEIIRALSKCDLKNLKVSNDKINFILNYKNFSNISELLEDIITNSSIYKKCKKSSNNQNVKYIIIKYGLHAFQWKKIKKVFANKVKFIYIYRHPCGVINSKLKTIRPYYPNEVMAWGGPLLAAFRWYQYNKAANDIKKAKINILEVKYEELLVNKDKILEKISKFLQTSLKLAQTTASTYYIPAKEQKIHSLVKSNKMYIDRASAWEVELSEHDRQIIEAVLHKKMKEKGYIPKYPMNIFNRTGIIIKAMPRTIFLIILHFIRIRSFS